MKDKSALPTHGENPVRIGTDGKTIAKGALLGHEELSSPSQGLQLARGFGPAKPYRNEQDILVCPPAYAKGFHHTRSR